MTLHQGPVTVPLAVIRRLPMYYRHLHLLQEKGVERVSSQQLALTMGITSSQLRQDLSLFGEFGQQGIGYQVDTLYQEISKILGLEQKYPAVLVGVGNLGRAILNYQGFHKRGLELKAAFDKDPLLCGNSIGGIPILAVNVLPDFLRREPITIGIITVPASAAQQAADTLTAGGIRAIWNFAPRTLTVPAEIQVEDTHIGDGLLQLLFKVKK